MTVSVPGPGVFVHPLRSFGLPHCVVAGVVDVEVPDALNHSVKVTFW